MIYEDLKLITIALITQPREFIKTIYYVMIP